MIKKYKWFITAAVCAIFPYTYRQIELRVPSYKHDTLSTSVVSILIIIGIVLVLSKIESLKQKDKDKEEKHNESTP